MQLTKNFSLHEFACNDANNTPVPFDLQPNVAELAKNLQVLRDVLGEPIHINSAYRTVAYNAKVGGKKNSFHLKAMAADITTKNKSPLELYIIIEQLISIGKMKQGGLGLYKGFVHYDIRGIHVRWKE